MKMKRLILPVFLLAFLFFPICSAIAGINDGLVAYYPFNGNSNDMSGNGQNGVPNGNITYVSSSTDLAAYFNGLSANAYVNCGDINALDGIQQFSAAVWIKPYNQNNRDWYPIFTKENSCTQGFGGFAISIGRNGEILWSLDDASAHVLTQMAPSGTINLNQWQQVVVIFDGTQSVTAEKAKIYVNGARVTTSFYGSQNYPFTQTYASNTSPLWIANGRGNSCGYSYYDGEVDELRFYNRVLSETEIGLLYSGGNSSETYMIQPGPVDGVDVVVTSVYYGGSLENTPEYISRVEVGGWGDYYYGLLRFDISSLPANITSAKIYLYCFGDNGGLHTSMYLDRITAPWDETTKWINQPSSTNIATIPTPTLNAWYVIDITDLYQQWKNGTYQNYGIKLRPTENWNKFNLFYSSDYIADPTLRPKLIIETPDAPNSPPSSPSTVSADVVSISNDGQTANIKFNWDASTDPDGDPVQYCLSVNKDSNPNDIPVYKGCDDGTFFSGTSSTISIPYEHGKTYWWAVWAKDSYGNWSAASDWRSYSTYSIRKGKIWGIFIGQKFSSDAIKGKGNLRGDLIAREIYDNFQFIADNRRILITDDGILPITKLRINVAIMAIKTFIQPGDTLFIYIVGHGGPFKIEDFGSETTITRANEYVVLNDMYDTITDDDLTCMLKGMEDVEKWIMVDACHSGGFWGNKNLYDIGDLEKLPKTCMMASAKEDGPGKYFDTHDYDAKCPDCYGKTVFGIHLRDAFAIKPNNHVNCDYNDDGVITFDELEYWMTERAKISWGWLNGLTVQTNDLGDDIIFSIDDWSPECKKSDDFEGSLGTISIFDPKANILGDTLGYVGVPIAFNASNSTSPNGDIKKYEWDWNGDGIYDEETSDPIIEHTFSNIYEGTVVLKITDIIDINDTTSISINVIKLNHAPVAVAGTNKDVEVGSNCLATVMLDGSGSYDEDGDALTYTWIWPGTNSGGGTSIQTPYTSGSFNNDGFTLTGVNPTVQLPVGKYTFQLVVNDGIASSQPATVEINVVETTPPKINVSVNPAVLWPPNHKMVKVIPTVTATDNCDPNPRIKLVSIKMNEGDQTNTYDPNYDSTPILGNTTGDIQFDQSGSIYLRAERSGTNINGRKYTITYSATDNQGNISTGSAIVTVPHNQ